VGRGRGLGNVQLWALQLEHLWLRAQAV